MDKKKEKEIAKSVATLPFVGIVYYLGKNILKVSMGVLLLYIIIGIVGYIIWIHSNSYEKEVQKRIQEEEKKEEEKRQNEIDGLKIREALSAVAFYTVTAGLWGAVLFYQWSVTINRLKKEEICSPSMAAVLYVICWVVSLLCMSRGFIIIIIITNIFIGCLLWYFAAHCKKIAVESDTDINSLKCSLIIFIVLGMFLSIIGPFSMLLSFGIMQAIFNKLIISTRQKNWH